MKVFNVHSPFDQRFCVCVYHVALFADFNATSVILSVSNIPKEFA